MTNDFVLFQVDLNHKSGQIDVAVGVDLTDYYPSIEWDILAAVSFKKYLMRFVLFFINKPTVIEPIRYFPYVIDYCFSFLLLQCIYFEITDTQNK